MCDVKNSAYGSAGRLLSLKVDVNGAFNKPEFPTYRSQLFKIVEANDVSLLVPFIRTVLAR